MKPILILQHEAGVSAGHFASWLAARSLPHRLVGVHRGEPVPTSAEPYAGVCSLGGNMSANDPLPWIAEELGLLRDAVDRGVPIIGHCLGGQLLAKALGAAVYRSPWKEMGWLPVEVVDVALVNEWLGSAAPGELFHWHGDAFDLPPGARRLLASPLTPNQACVVERAAVEHVGMQFHIEMTPELVTAWANEPGADVEVADERARSGGPGVQSPGDMCRDLERRCEAMRALAWRLYDRWACGLKR
ncbi:MAG TPA: type 1 glutamine amidotransferase [Burkholderiaceae bacterium]|nr:type 1 glutamine amidotransferase [Burkholderiaceae bacterium]